MLSLYRPQVVAFDVIETLFSLEPMRGRLLELGLPAEALELWFARLLRNAFALDSSGTFQPFGAQMALIAAHAWDVHGASQVGLVTGWVSRLEKLYHPGMNSPDASDDTLTEVSRQLLAMPTDSNNK